MPLVNVPTSAGAKGRDKRPDLDALMKAATKREFDMVAAWSVDHLGRSLQHLVQLFTEFQSLGVDLYLHQQHVDSSTPSGRALLQMSGVFAEFERAMLLDASEPASRARRPKASNSAGRGRSVTYTNSNAPARYGFLVHPPIFKTRGCGKARSRATSEIRNIEGIKRRFA